VGPGGGSVAVEERERGWLDVLGCQAPSLVTLAGLCSQN
jgi:hypothetical protein